MADDLDLEELPFDCEAMCALGLENSRSRSHIEIFQLLVIYTTNFNFGCGRAMPWPCHVALQNNNFIGLIFPGDNLFENNSKIRSLK